MDDVEIVVAKCKPLGQAKALAILSTFLRKDQAKQPDEQLPSDVLHQLQMVRDSLRGPGANSDNEDGEEDKAQHRIADTISRAVAPAPKAAPVAAAEVDASSSSPEKKRKKKQKKDKA